MKFTPHQTYEGLLTQANALARLVESLEGQVSHFRQKNYALSERRLQALEGSLESERAMNSILTAENEQYRQTLQNIVEGNYPHGDRRGKCPHGTYHWESCENCITDYIEAELSAHKPSVQATPQPPKMYDAETGEETHELSRIKWLSDPPKSDVLQPSPLEQKPNEQKPLDPSVLLETLQRDEFTQRDTL